MALVHKLGVHADTVYIRGDRLVVALVHVLGVHADTVYIRGDRLVVALVHVLGVHADIYQGGEVRSGTRVRGTCRLPSMSKHNETVGL